MESCNRTWYHFISFLTQFDPDFSDFDQSILRHDNISSAAFLLYAAAVVGIVIILIVQFIPQYGQSHVMVYIGVCSLVGSLSVCAQNFYSNVFINYLCFECQLFDWCEQVMSVKALGIALKLTFSGMNQLIYPQTWVFTLIVLTCVITQMNYLNKV